MSIKINELNGTLANFEELIAAIVAENCANMFYWGRKLIRKEYYDPQDPEALNYDAKGKKLTSKKRVEALYNEDKEWLTDPNSDFNTYWKSMMFTCKRGNEETLLDGKQIAEAIDIMIEDIDNFPEDERSFRQIKS